MNNNLRARACIKCHQYIVIYPNNALNQEYVKHFENYHKNHTLVTLVLSEVIGKFNIFQTKPLGNEAYKGNKSDKNSEKFQPQQSKNMEP